MYEKQMLLRRCAAQWNPVCNSAETEGGTQDNAAMGAKPLMLEPCIY
jgi:hypothetical protein